MTAAACEEDLQQRKSFILAFRFYTDRLLLLLTKRILSYYVVLFDLRVCILTASSSKKHCGTQRLISEAAGDHLFRFCKYYGLQKLIHVYIYYVDTKKKMINDKKKNVYLRILSHSPKSEIRIFFPYICTYDRSIRYVHSCIQLVIGASISGRLSRGPPKISRLSSVVSYCIAHNNFKYRNSK